jgi:D-methionine transport system ATP-binding protein
MWNSAFREVVDPVVRLENVRKVYSKGTHVAEALAGVDLAVERGSVQGIIGFSGAGKSTLLRCISRLEKPDSGRVIVAGTDLTGLEGEALRRERRKLGVVFQHLNLLHSRSVAANVALPLELAGTARDEVKTRVSELLDWFGLADKKAQYPGQLSGGQRQRVAIARALAVQPSVLLTDEPTSALDPETTASVLSLLRRVQREFHVTILLITHELSAARAICDRVAILDHGRITEEGPVERVLQRPESAAGKRLIRSHSDTDPILASVVAGGQR